ncbi:MAG: RidA family protein [Phycisphaerales bacterium]|nr:MAG: RidA family protein [Phycisphaerales bacterium]
MNRIRHRLEELNITLPEAPRPVAAYVPAVRSGDLIFVAGQIPFSGGELISAGSVPSAVSVDQAASAARQCALNGLAAAAALLSGDLDRISRIVRLDVFVASDAGFHDQATVANGASELLRDVFGEAGLHVRAAVGCIGLPLNATVMVEMVVEAP